MSHWGTNIRGCQPRQIAWRAITRWGIRGTSMRRCTSTVCSRPTVTLQSPACRSNPRLPPTDSHIVHPIHASYPWSADGIHRETTMGVDNPVHKSVIFVSAAWTICSPFHSSWQDPEMFPLDIAGDLQTLPDACTSVDNSDSLIENLIPMRAFLYYSR